MERNERERVGEGENLKVKEEKGDSMRDGETGNRRMCVCVLEHERLKVLTLRTSHQNPVKTHKTLHDVRQFVFSHVLALLQS